MKKLLILTLALTISTNCANHPVSQNNGGAMNQAPRGGPATPEPTKGLVDASAENQKTEETPLEFRGIDFKSHSYPISLRKKAIKLEDGKYEYREGVGGNSFELENVYYSDLDRDGRKEAIAHIFQLACGGSCDGGSHIFYFFSMRQGRLKLLSRIETGSLAYGECGLKAFLLRGGKLDLDVFHVCRFDGVWLKPSADPRPNPDAKVGKFVADKFTHFVLAFNGNRFVMRKREVSTNPQEEIMNYSAQIQISND